jgi:hypothetical protein
MLSTPMLPSSNEATRVPSISPVAGSNNNNWRPRFPPSQPVHLNIRPNDSKANVWIWKAIHMTWLTHVRPTNILREQGNCRIHRNYIQFWDGYLSINQKHATFCHQNAKLPTWRRKQNRFENIGKKRGWLCKT